VDLAWLVMRRSVDGIELHGLLSDIGDVVPGACGDQHAPAIGYFTVEREIIPGRAHLGPAAARIQPKELVSLGMGFQPDVTPHWNRHQGHLKVSPAPRNGAVVAVITRRLFKIERLRLRADIFDDHLARLSAKRDSTNVRVSSGEVERSWTPDGNIPVSLGMIAGRSRLPIGHRPCPCSSDSVPANRSNIARVSSGPSCDPAGCKEQGVLRKVRNRGSATRAGHTEAFRMTASARFAADGGIVIAVVIIWAHLAVAIFTIT